MRTKRWAGLIALAMLLALLGSALASAQRVYDGADLFTAGEEAALEAEIARFQEDTGMDFVVVTSDEPQEDGEQYRAADEFYIHGNFGLDSEDSGVLYYIDMYNRYQYLYTRGQMIDYLTGSRIDATTGGSQGLLAQGIT